MYFITYGQVQYVLNSEAEAVCDEIYAVSRNDE